jgi:hypothetical protein
MRRAVLLSLALCAPAVAARAEEWKNVPVVDQACLKDVKDAPDKHTKDCLLMCVAGGYGLLTPDGTYLKFDAAGNKKVEAALKATKKDDHLRATVKGERDGDTIKVASVLFD